MVDFNYRKFNALISMFDSISSHEAFKHADGMLKAHGKRWVDVISLNETEKSTNYNLDDSWEDSETSKHSGEDVKRTTVNLTETLSSLSSNVFKFGKRIINTTAFSDKGTTSVEAEFDSTESYRNTKIPSDVITVLIQDIREVPITRNNSVIVANLCNKDNEISHQDIRFTDFDDILFLRKHDKNDPIKVRIQRSLRNDRIQTALIYKG